MTCSAATAGATSVATWFAAGISAKSIVTNVAPAKGAMGPEGSATAAMRLPDLQEAFAALASPTGLSRVQACG